MLDADSLTLIAARRVAHFLPISEHVLWRHKLLTVNWLFRPRRRWQAGGQNAKTQCNGGQCDATMNHDAAPAKCVSSVAMTLGRRTGQKITNAIVIN
jgi:hypothetical protein